MRQCASIYGVDPATIHNRLREYKIQTRTVSQANKGRVVWNKGKTNVYSPEQIKRISEGHKGQIPWNKGRKSELCGDKHPMWKGGVTSLRTLLSVQLEYKEWRMAIFKRDDFTCQQCREKDKHLNAHHIKPLSEIIANNQITTVKQAVSCSEILDIENGVTLCVDCHGKIDKWRSKFTGYRGQMSLPIYLKAGG